MDCHSDRETVAQWPDDSDNIKVFVRNRRKDIQPPKQLTDVACCPMVESAADQPQGPSFILQACPQSVADDLFVANE